MSMKSCSFNTPDNSEINELDITFCSSVDGGSEDCFYSRFENENTTYNEIGIIIGDNSSLVSSFDLDHPTLRGCLALDISSAKTKSTSIDVRDFCSKFHHLVSSYKFVSSSRSNALTSELHGMKKGCFKGADARRFTKLVSNALMDANMFSLGTYVINIQHAGLLILESEASAIKIQKFIRSSHRNALLKKSILQLHHFCTLPYVRPMELDFIKSSLASDPSLKMIRNKWKSYCTLTQSALIGCNIAVLSLLNPTFRELIEVDSTGKSSIHYLSFAPNMKVAMCLAGILNAVTAFLPVAIDCSEFLQRNAFTMDGAGNISYCSKVVKVGWLMKQKRSFSYFGVFKNALHSWRKRWVVLCEDSICYYSTADTSNCKPKYTLSLAGCSVRRVSEYVLEIRSEATNNSSLNRTFFGRPSTPPPYLQKLLLKASSEAEMQSWMKYLCGLTGSIDPLAISQASSTRYVNQELRERWVSSADKNGDTALHIMVRHNKGRNMEAVKQIAWLVDNGCPVNAQNAQGLTALHIAVLSSTNKDLIRCLLSKGADVNKLQDGEGRTVMDITSAQVPLMIRENHSSSNSLVLFNNNNSIESNLANINIHHSHHLHHHSHDSSPQHNHQHQHNLSSCSSGSIAEIADGRAKQLLCELLLQHTEQVKRYEHYYLFAEVRHNLRLFTGYTYLSLYLGKMSFALDRDSEHRAVTTNPYLTISVFSGRDELIEEVQDIWNPAMMRPSMIYWGWSWRMTTPLENLPSASGGSDGGDSNPCYVLFESGDKDSADSTHLICKVKFPMDLTTLNSGPKTLRADSQQPSQQQLHQHHQQQQPLVVQQQCGRRLGLGLRSSAAASEGVAATASLESNFNFPNALSCESSDDGAHLSIDIILSHGTTGC